MPKLAPLLFVILLSAPPAPAAEPETVVASSFGFDENDATEALQAAIDSGAARVVVPHMGKPWIVRPVTLRSNLELILEPGVTILAKKGEFKGPGDRLLSAVDAENITVRGYGATLRMRKADYAGPDYERGEWRMTLSIMGCKNILVEGIRCESSGGDGIYIGSSAKNRWCENVTVRDAACLDNFRQGISVISAVNLLIENCVLSGTSGTPPGAGIDLEPDSPDERLVNCVIRNCVMEDNEGHAMLVYLRPLTRESEPVSILFENCLARMDADRLAEHPAMGWSGMAVGSAVDGGPAGSIVFRNCVSENTGREGARIFDKSPDSVAVRFENCRWINPWRQHHPGFPGLRVPVLIHSQHPDRTLANGGVEFSDCAVFDDVNRSIIGFYADSEAEGVRAEAIRGNIAAWIPGRPRTMAGAGAANIQVNFNQIDRKEND